MPNDPKVDVTLRHGSSQHSASFNVNNKVEKIRDEGGKAFKLDAKLLPDYTLHLELPDGSKQQLATTQKISATGIRDGSIIVFQPPDGVQG